ncbi:spindle and kinetochore-associated protein 3 [Carettochelys insculpta]|uniref:spindle and kinetochore-associated protein 3 n=1 Tax=Carettochelys insculpta TaxID=44489 RepID=UPI003EBCDEF3
MMEITGNFFNKLRALAVTLEKEAEQLEQALNGENTEHEDESPMRVLHDLHCEVRTLKGDINATLDQSRSERQETYDFMKAIKVLMQRNATDLEKIRELFQKYGYKPPDKDKSVVEEDEGNPASEVSDQTNSNQGKVEDMSSLPACIEKIPVPKDPLRNPQLSDFGLSQYAFSRTWDAMDIQSQTSMHKEDSRNRIPTPKQTPYMLPKTPKCTLKMDDYECLTPKLEHFGISEHTVCLNEDYTMALINKNVQVRKTFPKEDDDKICLAAAISSKSNETVITPGPAMKISNKNAIDCIASPLIPVFCTPGLKIPSRRDNNILPKSLEKQESNTSSHTATPTLPDFETGCLKTDANPLKGSKAESLPEIYMTDKQHIEDCATDKYLEHLGGPSPPKISDYENFLNTPPPPEITKIPEDILQILSKYNPKTDTPKMETKTRIATRFDRNVPDYCNKENRAVCLLPEDQSPSGLFRHSSVHDLDH